MKRRNRKKLKQMLRDRVVDVAAVGFNSFTIDGRVYLVPDDIPLADGFDLVMQKNDQASHA